MIDTATIALKTIISVKRVSIAENGEQVPEIIRREIWVSKEGVAGFCTTWLHKRSSNQAYPLMLLRFWKLTCRTPCWLLGGVKRNEFFFWAIALEASNS